jgi:reverse gyrase
LRKYVYCGGEGEQQDERLLVKAACEGCLEENE